MPDRTFTEEEVAALFKRASELQAEQIREDPPNKPRLTLDELSTIAAEVGLEPGHVQLAADELSQASTIRRRGESSVHATEIFADRRVSEVVRKEITEDIIAELHHRFDTSAGECMGMPRYGRSIDWKHTNLWGIETHVLLQSRDDHFRIRVSRRTEWGSVTNWTSFAALIALVAGYLAAPALGSYLLGLLVGIVTLLMTIPLMRGLNSRWVETQRREVEQLADSIADQVLRTTHVDPAAASISSNSISASDYQSPSERTLPTVESERPTRS